MPFPTLSVYLGLTFLGTHRRLVMDFIYTHAVCMRQVPVIKFDIIPNIDLHVRWSIVWSFSILKIPTLSYRTSI